MARQLLLLRHAKSAWPTGVADMDRPLAPRGERDCIAVGRFLAQSGLLVDHAVCSPAVRTRETIRRVLDAAGNRVVVSVEPELYDGDGFRVVRDFPTSASRVLVVGHEPELLELTRRLSGAEARLPTAALLVLELEAPWEQQPVGPVELLTLVTPKLLAAANSTTV